MFWCTAAIWKYLNPRKLDAPSVTNQFQTLLSSIRKLSKEQKQIIFCEIRESIIVHKLENEFNISAETILEAISRASDITKRGVRGVIAETVFTQEVVSTLEGWQNCTPDGDYPYDVRLTDGQRYARIQVKLQRKERGQPKMRRPKGRTFGPADYYAVEVQRTRTGENGTGLQTRPYKFSEFDVIAVNMEPSTGDWRKFMYAHVSALGPVRV